MEKNHIGDSKLTNSMLGAHKLGAPSLHASVVGKKIHKA